jgi:hypothetical protein
MSQTELLNNIRQLNTDVKVDSERNRYLKNLLSKEPGIMGIIISKPTGKCVGTIEKNTGKISHVSNKEAKSPYNIVVKNDRVDIHDMLIKNDLHGLAADKIVLKVMSNSNMKILGQTVDIKGKIVGLIIRTREGNNYIQTQAGEPLSDIPILAILHKAIPADAKPVVPAAAPPVAPVAPVAPVKPTPVIPTPPKPVESKLAPPQAPQGACVKPSACTAEPVIASSTVKSNPINKAATGIKTQVSKFWKMI